MTFVIRPFSAEREENRRDMIIKHKCSFKLFTYKGNERIDEIAEKWELIGTHTGRRTFIIHALSRGIPPSVVMKWTGHSDYKSMKPYIDIVDEIKASEMTKMNFMD